MKKISSFAFYLILFFSAENAFAQDTLIAFNKFKYKTGLKLISEESGDPARYPGDYRVFSGGIQVIRKLNNSHFSIETGIYYINRAITNYLVEYTGGQHLAEEAPFYYHNLSIPLSIRYDTRIAYFAAGIYGDYLLYRDPGGRLYTDSVSYKGEDRKLNFGVNFSIGLEKNISKYMSVFVEGRYSAGFNLPKLENSPRESTLNFPGFCNYGFALGLNYKLPSKQSTDL